MIKVLAQAIPVPIIQTLRLSLPLVEASSGDQVIWSSQRGVYRTYAGCSLEIERSVTNHQPAPVVVISKPGYLKESDEGLIPDLPIAWFGQQLCRLCAKCERSTPQCAPDVRGMCLTGAVRGESLPVWERPHPASDYARKRGMTAMLTIEKSLVINAPVENVFAYIADPKHLPEYIRGVERITKVQRLPSQGYRFQFVDKISGKLVVAQGECTEFVPNERLVVRLHAAPENETLTTTLVAVEGGQTRITCVEEYTLHGGFLGRLGEAFLMDCLFPADEMTLAALKTRLETGDVPPKVHSEDRILAATPL